MHEVNDGNVAYTRRTALKVIERQVYDFANSPYRPEGVIQPMNNAALPTERSPPFRAARWPLPLTYHPVPDIA